jgi:hypothetical protein
LTDVSALVAQVLAELPLPEDLRVVSVRSALGGAGDPGLEAVYLADAELGGDAHAILVRLLALRTGVPGDHVALLWMPTTVDLAVSSRGVVADRHEAALATLGVMLAAVPGVDVVLELPSGLPTRAAEAALSTVQRQLRRATMTVASARPGAKDGSATVRVSVPPDNGPTKPGGPR